MLEKETKSDDEPSFYKPWYWERNNTVKCFRDKGYKCINLDNYIIAANSDVSAVLKFHKLVGNILFSSCADDELYDWNTMTDKEIKDMCECLVGELTRYNDCLWLEKNLKFIR